MRQMAKVLTLPTKAMTRFFQDSTDDEYGKPESKSAELEQDALSNSVACRRVEKELHFLPEAILEYFVDGNEKIEF